MLTDQEAARILSAMDPASSASRGGNSRVVRVEHAGAVYAVKDYSARSDGRARLEREWLALHFLSAHIPDLVSSPVWRSRFEPTAIHAWLPGRPPALDPSSVDAMVLRIDDLHRLRTVAAAADLPPAVDAVRDAHDLVGQIRARCTMLAGHAAEQVDLGVREILEALVAMLVREASGGAGSGPGAKEWAGDSVLTLSPSDLGPHNLLKDPSGSPYRIIDLEFFGVDDAHKLVGDTILHPQNVWDLALLERFLSGANDVFGLRDARLAEMLPLLALKWSTIVLARLARSIDGTSPGASRQSSQHEIDVSAELLAHFLAVARAPRHDARLGLVCSRQRPSRPASEALA